MDSNTLVASLLWGSLGTGLVVYGKKQAATIPLVGGIILVAVSYLIPSPVYLSLVSIILIAGMFKLVKMGY